MQTNADERDDRQHRKDVWVWAISLILLALAIWAILEFLTPPQLHDGTPDPPPIPPAAKAAIGDISIVTGFGSHYLWES